MKVSVEFNTNLESCFWSGCALREALEDALNVTFFEKVILGLSRNSCVSDVDQPQPQSLLCKINDIFLGALVTVESFAKESSAVRRMLSIMAVYVLVTIL